MSCGSTCRAHSGLPVRWSSLATALVHLFGPGRLAPHGWRGLPGIGAGFATVANRFPSPSNAGVCHRPPPALTVGAPHRPSGTVCPLQRGSPLGPSSAHKTPPAPPRPPRPPGRAGAVLPFRTRRHGRDEDRAVVVPGRHVDALVFVGEQAAPPQLSAGARVARERAQPRRPAHPPLA